MQRAIRPILATALLTSVAGCGGAGSDAPEIAPVSGIVTVNGEPRASLNVVFYPETGGRPANGTTGADGTFTLTTLNTNDGAPVGTNKVAITSSSAGKDWGIDGPPQPGRPGYEEWRKEEAKKIDPKFSDPEKSGLLYTVPPEGFDNLEIKIES